MIIKTLSYSPANVSLYETIHHSYIHEFPAGLMTVLYFFPLNVERAVNLMFNFKMM